MNSSEASNTEELKTDIVILGGGGAGVAAAIAAREKGVKDIILLEARGKPGGNSAMAGGLFAAESPAQKRLGINARRDDLFRKQMDYAHWRINARLVRVFIDKSGDTIRWLEEMGAKFERVVPLYPTEVPLFHSCGPKKTGAPLMKVLVKRCEDLGVRPLCQTAGKKLITDEKGKVVGVLAKAKDKELRIMAKCVIIATGGCLGNKKLLEKYYPSSENIAVAGLPIKGDGLLMAMEIGAAMEGMGTLEINGPDFQPSWTLTIFGMQPNTIWVNKRGERFTDESIASRSFSDSGNTIIRQPGKISYTLFDRKIKQSLAEEGLVGGHQSWVMGVHKWVWAKNELPKLEREFQIQAAKGNIKISDSWDEIARWMGAPPEALKATVDEYNSFCDQGYDKIFAKERGFLLPLRTPPYYAMECHVHVYNTLGGIKINHLMEALNHQDNPIPGLYAAGVDTGGWESDTYNVGLAGHSIGFAINSGRIAGENAAEYVLGVRV